MKFRNIAFTSFLLLASSIASATLIVEVSDIQLTGGSNRFLTWSTTEFDDFSFGLDAASSQQYGTFSTNDFPIRYCEGRLCFGSDFDIDRISASFLLTPPNRTASTSGAVFAIGHFGILNDQLFVNFDNNWIDMGIFEVSFQDAAMIEDGTINLFADFRMINTTDPSGNPNVNVTEPSVIALFAVGLLGLGFARRRTF